MPRINYGTSKLYDTYEKAINSYIKDVYGYDYFKAIYFADLTPAAMKYKLLVEMMDSLLVSSDEPIDSKGSTVEVIDRPTTDEHHGGKNDAPEYTVQDKGQYTEVKGEEEAQVYATA